MSQREGFWQQVEEKARLHPEWKKIGAEFRNTSFSEADETAEGVEATNEGENDNLTYDKLEHESRDVSGLIPNPIANPSLLHHRNADDRLGD